MQTEKHTPHRVDLREHLQRANQHLQRGNVQLAQQLYQHILRHDPDHLETLYAYGVMAQNHKRYKLAAELLHRAHKQVPSHGKIALALARLFEQTGNPYQAIRVLERYSEFGKASSAHVKMLSRLYIEQELYDKAEVCIRTLSKLLPDDPESLFIMGKWMFHTKNSKGAQLAIQRAIHLNADISSEAYYYLAQTGITEGVRAYEMQVMEQRHKYSPDDYAGYTLGKLHHDNGLYEHAWKYWHEANAHVAAQVPYDQKAHFQQYQNMLAFYDESYLKRHQAIEGTDSTRPVFIVGMPGSGVHSVAQLFAHHPGCLMVHDKQSIERLIRSLSQASQNGASYPLCMESLPASSLCFIANRYLASVRKKDWNARKLVHYNGYHFRHLGLISRLFPHATIIHCTRKKEDVLATLFAQNHAPFTSSLKTISEFYDLYERMMVHWKSNTRLKIVEVSFDGLFRNRLSAAKNLCENVGLPWFSECLHWEENPHDINHAVTAEHYQAMLKPYLTPTHSAV